MNAYLVFLLCVLLMEDGKVYKKNPKWRPHQRRKNKEPMFIHWATFPPEKRLGGIAVTWLDAMLFGGKKSRLDSTIQALQDLYNRLTI